MVDLDDNQVIWRYMPQNKFLRMLHQKGLYFCGARHFDDMFEGQYAWSSGYNNFIKFHQKEAEKNGNGMPWQTWTLMHLFDLELERRRSYVSCWFQDPHESEAMWQLYCKGELENAVAVKTTVGKLKLALKKSKYSNFYLGKVKYHESFFWNSRRTTPEILFHKRKAYEHEKEFRAVLHLNSLNDAYQKNEQCGILVNVHLNQLIDEVKLSPFYNYNKSYKELEEATKPFNLKISPSEIESELPAHLNYETVYIGPPRNAKERLELKKLRKRAESQEIIHKSSTEIQIIRFFENKVLELCVRLKLRADIAAIEGLPASTPKEI